MRTRGVALALTAATLGWAPGAGAATCLDAPELCGLPVTSVLEQPDHAHAVDVVLVGDGFTDLEDWHAVADDMIAAFKWQQATGVYGGVDEVWNLHVVDLLTPEGGDVTNDDQEDTPLGMISIGSSPIVARNDRAALAATSAPDVDTVVAVANSESGRANAFFPSQLASGSVIRITRKPKALTHELGHGVFWLADEYVEDSACLPKTDAQLIRRRNVTADPLCRKFQHTPGAGCVEGGNYCSEGIWRPLPLCFMRWSGNNPACPVCYETIQDILIEVRTGVGVAAPWVAVSSPGEGSVVSGVLTLAASFHDDGFAPVDIAFEVDGSHVGSAEAWAFAGVLPFDTTALADGAHTIVAHVSDALGQARSSPPVTFYTANGGSSGAAAPSAEVVIQSPNAGTTVKGLTTVKGALSAADADFQPLAYGVLTVDGVPAAAAAGGGLIFPWDTTTSAIGPVVLRVLAVDTAGRVASSEARTVFVGPPAASGDEEALLLEPSDWSLVGPQLVMAWTGVGAEVPCQAAVDGTPVPLGLATAGDTTLASADASGWAIGPHRVAIACGDVLDAEVVVVRVATAPGQEPVRLVDPAPKTIRRGVVELLVAADAATEAEEVGVVVDGVLAATAPGDVAGVLWDSSQADDMCHAVAPAALSGGAIVATGVPVIVCTDNTPPLVALISPAAGAAVAASATVVVASAADAATKLTYAELVVDGEVAATAQPTWTNTWAWGVALVTPLAAGAHAVALRVEDQAGNVAETETIEVVATGCDDDGACDDGDACTTDACAGLGVCSHSPTPGCCVGACDDGDACTLDACDDSGCKHVPLAGCCHHAVECDDGDPCTIDACADEKGLGFGSCAHAPAPCCEDDDDCDDGDPCTADACLGGPAGTCAQSLVPGCCLDAGHCDDGDPCTDDACDEGAGCVHTPTAGACCHVDSDCGSQALCVADQCVPTAPAVLGSSCDSHDDCDTLDPCDYTLCFNNVCRKEPVPGCCVFDDDCTAGGACLAGRCDHGDCLSVPACCEVDEDCDDGDPCTAGVCLDGACTYPPIAPGCCDDDADCEDWDACTVDTCSEGLCSHVPGETPCCATAADCDDADACTLDSCTAGVCEHVPLGACCDADADCDDGNPCVDWSCQGGGCVAVPEAGCCNLAAECDDGDPCTEDLCTEHACEQLPVADCCHTHADCADEDPCTVTACAQNACTAVTMPGCCDGDDDCAVTIPCHEGLCLAGACTVVLGPGCCTTHAGCDDDDPCTVDACVDGSCQSVELPGCSD